MSEEGYRRRKRVQKKIARFIFKFVLFYAIAAFILIVINVIGLFFGGFPVIERILNIMGFAAGFVFAAASYVASLPFVMPVLGTIIFLVVLFKLFIRGYWVLITRPWVLLTSAVTLAAVIWVWNNFTPGFMTYCRFIIDGPFAMLEIVLRAFASAVPETAFAIEDIINVSTLIYYSISYYISPVTTWFVGLFLMSRITILFNSSFGYDEIIDRCPALEIADDVASEARKLTHRIPKHVIFYIEPGDGINACAFDHNKVAMTKALMESGNEELIRAVIGHELGHIANKDVSANLIAGSNVKLVCGLFTIPYFLLYGQSDKNNNINVGPLVFVLIILALIGRIFNGIINTAHYVCYIFGGKRCEYKADRFSSRLGYGVGLLNFMLSYYEAPSGGIKDPHPSMKNRIKSISEYIVKHPKKYAENVVAEARKLKADPDGYYNALAAR